MPRLKAIVWDTMVEQHLCMPDLEHSLNFCGSIFVQKERWKHQHRDNEEVYCCRDVDSTGMIHAQLLTILKKENLLDLYLNVQVPLARICHLMSESGIKVDPARVKTVRARLLKELAELELTLPKKLQTYDEVVNRRSLAPPGTLSAKTGKPLKYVLSPTAIPVVPWRSPEFLRDYFYRELKLPEQLHPKTKEVTIDKGALDKLYRKTKLPELATLRKLKKISTLLSSFTSEALLARGFQHTHFNVHGTASGRLSSSDPNLQNQPESARYLYVPRHEGWEFLAVDYSGIENQLTALFADDTERLAKFLSDPDYSEHRHAVEVFFGIPYDEVEKDNDKDAPYGKAKRIVHGANYGLGARKLANMYDMDERECKELIAKWKNALPKTTEWQNATAKMAEQLGVLTSVFGRKRWFWCASPEMRTLTTDMKWVQVSSLKEGDALVAFNEDLSSHVQIPRYKQAIVTRAVPAEAPRTWVRTSEGDALVTNNHAWAVVLSNAGRYVTRWIATEQLQVGDQILFFNKPWNTEQSYDAGWLAGILDGEGTVQKTGRGRIDIAQRPGVVLEKVLGLLAHYGIRHGAPQIRENGCTQTTLDKMSPRSVLETLGRFQPQRLLKNARPLWDGAPMWGRTRRDTATVLALEPGGTGPIVEVTTDSKTLLLEGLCSHNTDSVYTESLSFLPQSSAADVIFRSMIGLYFERVGLSLDRARVVAPICRPLPKPALLVLQVHDELLFEMPGEMLYDVAGIVKEVMNQPWPELGGFRVPVHLSHSRESWGELEPLHV